KESEAHAQLATLTPRETDVLHHLMSGLSNKAIAGRLGLSPRTVEVHRAHIMEKTQVKSLSHLIRLCVLAGLEPEIEGPSSS
ncbi:MAG: LuxR C-terminal-related transcriptional regulator, partial [Hyphomicrobiaceae bacterium]|nr:LuxR C-terminal-related transcriptional regulator [Hyphomicrobiaceae bacterium]